MPTMTKTALSDCSYPESMAYNIRDDIDATITRLKAVIDEEASLRNALRALFDKRREEAAEQVRMANLHLHLVHQEEAAFCADVRHASTKIKEELGGSVTVGLLRANLAPQRPLSFELSSPPPVHVEIGSKEDLYSRMSSPLHVDFSPRPDSMVDAVHDTSLGPPTILAPPRMPQQFPSIYSLSPPRSPAQSTYGNEPPRSPARATNNFQPPGAPAQSHHGLNPHVSPAQPPYKLEPSTSPARSSQGIQPPRSPAWSSRAFSPTMSPVRYTCGIDLTRSYAQPTRGPDGNPLPRSPALFNRGPPCDAPAPSFEELVDRKYHIQTPLPQLPEAPVNVLAPSPGKSKKQKKGKSGGGDELCAPQQVKDIQVPESKEDAEPISPEAERITLDMVDEEPKKAAGTKATEAKKKKAKSKKGNAKDTETKPTPIFPTDEAPPKLDANEPNSFRVNEDEVYAAKDGGRERFFAALARNKKGSLLNRAAKAKKPNLLPMTTADLTGETLTTSFHNDPRVPLKSPVRSARGLDPATSPARSARGFHDGPVFISPTRFNRGLPSDAPPRSPVRSTRGLGDPYLPPDAAGHSHRTPGKTQTSLPAVLFGDNYGSGIEEPKKSPACPSTTLPTTFAVGRGGFGTIPMTNTGFGFGPSPSANATFGVSASPTKNTGFSFGAGSQPPSAGIGFGAASLGNASVGFGGPSAALNFGLRPHHPTFDAIADPMQTPVAVEETPASMDDLFADMRQDADIEGGDTWGFRVDADGDNLDADFDEYRGKSPKAVANDYFGEQLDSGYKHDDVGISGGGATGQNKELVGDFETVDGQDHTPTPLARGPSPVPEPPEAPPVAVVAPKKKKKGKKPRKDTLMDLLAPKQPAADADAEERAVMEEIKLSEEDKLEAELRQLEVVEAEMAEQKRREGARLLAEAAENERIERELLEDEEERQHMVAKESDYLHYLSLKEAAVIAEERLSMVQAELDALEAQKLVILRQAESAREQEASCRYMRSR